MTQCSDGLPCLAGCFEKTARPRNASPGKIVWNLSLELLVVLSCSNGGCEGITLLYYAAWRKRDHFVNVSQLQIMRVHLQTTNVGDCCGD